MSSTGLVAELERLAIAVSGQEPREEEISLPSVAERVAKVFGVKPNEVAVLAVSAKWRHLHFLVPQALKKRSSHGRSHSETRQRADYAR